MMHKIKAHFILEEIKSDRDASGKFGEYLAKSWLEDDQWDLLDLNNGDQDFFSDELYEIGGKKPDFIGMADGISGVVLWDAKFHNVHDGIFKLENQELQKYKALHKYFRTKTQDNVCVIFMVIPKQSNGNKMYFVDLLQFENEGVLIDFNGKQATQINLKDKDCYDTSKYQKHVLENGSKN